MSPKSQQCWLVSPAHQHTIRLRRLFGVRMIENRLRNRTLPTFNTNTLDLHVRSVRLSEALIAVIDTLFVVELKNVSNGSEV